MTNDPWIYHVLDASQPADQQRFRYIPNWCQFSLIYPDMLERRAAIVAVDPYAKEHAAGILLYCPSTYVENALCLTAIEVEPSYREKGIGKALIQRFLNTCTQEKKNATHTSLENHPGALTIPKMFKHWASESQYSKQRMYIPPEEWNNPRSDYDLSY
jgi:GNAT superfamily N-acetyltransferase